MIYTTTCTYVTNVSTLIKIIHNTTHRSLALIRRSQRPVASDLPMGVSATVSVGTKRESWGSAWRPHKFLRRSVLERFHTQLRWTGSRRERLSTRWSGVWTWVSPTNRYCSCICLSVRWVRFYGTSIGSPTTLRCLTLGDGSPLGLNCVSSALTQFVVELLAQRILTTEV